MYIIYVFIITKSITAIFKAKFSLLESAQGLTQGFYLAPVNSEFGKYLLPSPHSSLTEITAPYKLLFN